MPLALIVEDEPRSREALAELVAGEGFEVLTASTLGEGVRALDSDPDVVLCDLVLPDGRGGELLAKVEDRPGLEFVVVTGKASVESAVEALRGGASDYLTKPVDVSRLRALLTNVKRTRELKLEIDSLRRELKGLGRFGDLIGASPAMQHVYGLIERVAPTSASVLLVGESGTGKELAARALHRLSRRRDRAFIPINCGAIAPSLMESELFGHEKGSFTGASRQHRGYFEQADGGTLFLDEITEMPFEFQVKLLRVLESGSVVPVGAGRAKPIDVRVIGGTNRDPERAIADERLRPDLYYRLNVFPVVLPPLRHREGDVRLLAEAFLDGLNDGAEKAKRLSAEALEALSEYNWPGNVRELKNTIERAFILAEETLSLDTLPREVLRRERLDGPSFQVRVGSTIADAERRLIMATLEQMGGNKTRTAETLGISVKTLYNRLSRYARESD